MSAARAAARIGLPLVPMLLLASVLLSLWRTVGIDPVTERVEQALLDLRFRLRGPIAPPDGVVIVAIDEAAVREIGMMGPMRAALATAVERISAAGPSAIAIDLLLVDQTAADPALAAALGRGGRTILAAARAAGGPPPPGGTPDAAPLAPELLAARERSLFRVVAREGSDGPPDAETELLYPARGLIGGAWLGHVNIDRASDRVARQVPLALPLGGNAALPAMPLVAARLALGLAPGEMALWSGYRVDLGDRPIPTDAAQRVVLNHYGPPGTMDTVRLTDVLAGTVPAERFAGRAVFVGASAESLGDQFATPFAPDVSGVEVLATLTGNLVDGTLITRGLPAALATLGLALILTVAARHAACARLVPVALLKTLGVWILAGVAIQGAFVYGRLWVDAVTVLGSAMLASTATWALGISDERRRGARIAEDWANLIHYVSPLAAQALAGVPAPGGGPASVPAGETGVAPWTARRTDASIVFVDIANYTGWAEDRAPEAAARFLAAVHDRIARGAAADGGMVVEILGDGALVAFGLSGPPAVGASAVGPPTPGGPPSAAAAALGFAEGLLGAPSGGGPELRVSVHHGPVAVANVGGAARAHLTVTGDTVNVAARLHEVAKTFGARIVASRAALDAAGQPTEDGRYTWLITDPMRGRQHPVEVWTLRAA